MDQEEAVKIFDLVVRGGTLPASLDKLVPLSFIGAAAVTFYKAKVKLMDQLGMTKEQRKVTLRDGQEAGIMLLYIEARIGELSYKIPDAPHIRHDALPKGADHPTLKHEKMGLTLKQKGNAQQIHRNPAAVAAIIAEAEENEDIPTKTAVLNRIKYEKEKKYNAKSRAVAKTNIEKLTVYEERGEMAAWGRIYLDIHERRKIVEMSGKAQSEIVKIITKIKAELDAKIWEVQNETE